MTSASPVDADAPIAPAKPRVALLLPPDTRAKVLSQAAEEILASVARVMAPPDGPMTSQGLPRLLEGATAVLTGWGTPPFPPEVLSDASELAFIAHAAGSIHRLQVSSAIESGRIKVSHTAAIIADAVAEFVLAQTLSHLRRPHRQDAEMKAGMEWFEVRRRNLGRLLGAQTVGIVGAGYVGRLVIRMLKGFDARIIVYDPYLATERARELGVELSALDELFATSDIVSLHAPVLSETRHMVGADQLARLRDGALLINTARAALVDEDALLSALRQGRFDAAIDVFDSEPLPVDSPFRSLPNAYLSPHSAGHTTDTYLRQGATAVAEIQRFLSSQPLKYEVTKNMLAIMA